ncbi:MAG: hypothetical protein DKT66_12890 [Candidatus Melainabacteria bacterium]|nr:MAG: hypothetical protein DKT66_12890 [Candidatus Melainabacteria bacterium]
MFRPLLYKTFYTLGKREVARFDRDAQTVDATQSRHLLDIIQRNAASAFGKKHGFSSIQSVRDFQNAVAINDYDSLSEYVNRAAAGEKGQLTVEDPFMFATTSGTAGERKMIPVTRSYIKEFRRASVVSGFNLLKSHPNLTKGIALSVFSPAEEGRTEGGIPYGAISGRLYMEEPKLIKRFISPIPYEVFIIKHYESRYYTLLRLALALPVTVIYTLNPSTIVMLGKRLKIYGEQLVRDIADGAINSPQALPSQVMEAIKPFLKPNPKRAAELAKLLEQDKFEAQNIWPDLSLISCWTKAAASFYLQDLPAYFGSTPVADITYGASEGRGTVNLGEGRQALSIRSHFFEFVAVDDWEAGNKKALLCHELEVGREYYILFTTSGGLYRYHINDIVKVVGWYNRTPLIEFLHKGGNISSFTGEKLTESQVTEAMLAAQKELNFRARFFTLIPVFRPEPHYELYLEFDGPSVSDETALAKAFDRHLSRLNIEYEAKRESHRLTDIKVVRLPAESYERLRKELVGQGVPDAQIKVSHLNPKDQIRQMIQGFEEVGSTAVSPIGSH